MSEGLELTQDGDFDIIRKLLKEFPKMRAGVMHEVGYQSRKLLYTKILSGQVIQLHKKVDKIGRRTYGYSMGRFARSVHISAYPLNLFGARKIYNNQLKPIVNSELPKILNNYDRNVLEKQIKKLDKLGV